MADRIAKSIIVQGDIDHIYDLWANFENFPHFMHNIKSVTKTGDMMSHWVMEGSPGTEIEWDAKTTLLDENQRIACNRWIMAVSPPAGKLPLPLYHRSKWKRR